MTRGDIEYLKWAHQEYDEACTLCDQDPEDIGIWTKLPWPCPVIRLLNEHEVATRVIAAVQARRAASREYDRVRSDSADVQEWRYIRDKYMHMLQEETRALMDWEKVTNG